MGKKVYPQKKGHVKKTMSLTFENMFHLKKWVAVEKNGSHLKKDGSHFQN